jgi:hypothetical protein
MTNEPTQPPGKRPEIARPVEILVGRREIAVFLRVSKDEVSRMETGGAPILRDRHGVMRAEKAELWAWWRA